MLSSEQTAAFERAVTPRLRALAGRLRLYVLADGLATALVVLVAFVLVQLLLDRTLRLRQDMRAALLAVGVVAVGYAVWRWIIRPLRRAVTTDAAALLVERTFPQLGDRLISALQFCSLARNGGFDGHASPALMGRVVEQARAAADPLRFEDALDHKRAAQRGAISAACVVGFAVGCLLFSDLMGIWFQRNVLLADVPWPQRTHLRVEGVGDDNRLIHPSGDDLQINVLAQGAVPRSVQLEYAPIRETAKSGAMESGELAMLKLGDRRFRASFPQFRHEIEFRAVGGDAATEWITVVVVDRPSVVEAQVSVAPPAYTGRPTEELRTGQTVAEVLRGSRVTLAVKTNKPVAAAALLRDDSPVEEVDGAAGQDRFQATFTPAESGSYRFRLTDENGLTNRRPVVFSVRVVSDRPPRVTLRIPGLGEMVTPDATLPTTIDMTDTYGMQSAALVHTATRPAGNVPPASQPTTAPAEKTFALPDFEPGSTSFSTSLNFELSPLGLEPGQRLTLRARATDGDTVGGPNVGNSTTFSLRVVAADELLAELSRREQEYRREFERVIRDQEELRGRLLSSLNALRAAGGDEQPQRAVRTQYRMHERRQSELTRRVTGIRTQFQRILSEMEISHVATRSVRLRLENRIVTPLQALGRKQMVAAGDQLGTVARADAGADPNQVDPTQAAVVEQMRAILSHMLQWEGFHEAVAILRSIIKMQGSLNEETEAELERRVREILGNESPPGSSKQ